MLAGRLSVCRSEAAERKIKERRPFNPSPRYDRGKAHDCYRERGPVAFGERHADKRSNRPKNVETRKISPGKRIKMVILQT